MVLYSRKSLLHIYFELLSFLLCCTFKIEWCFVVSVTMNNKLLETYFTFVTWLLHSVAAIPEKKLMKTELRTFLFNKVWPATFLFFWAPLVPMVTLKIHQYIAKKEWEDFLDIMHMYFLGCNTLYIVFAVQRIPKFYKTTMENIKRNFLGCDDFGLNDFSMMMVLWIAISLSFVSYVLGSIYYGEVLVPLWIPFIDNDQPLTTVLFFAVWAYEGLAGVYMLIAYGFLSPFVIVSNMVIIKEINYLIKKMKDLKFCNCNDQCLSSCNLIYNKSEISTIITLHSNTANMEKQEIIERRDDILRTSCFSESDTKSFTRNFVKHHQNIRRVIHDVSKIHDYVFLTQALFTITHSCFLAFNMYYTERLNKVIIKSSPILFLSYYLLYIYCWNGQRLTDTCDRLFRALYECEWYNCPRSFKTSLIIMMEFCRLPVKYTGGGIFTASFETFLHGFQQSISYILLLKQLTPENKTK